MNFRTIITKSIKVYLSLFFNKNKVDFNFDDRFSFVLDGQEQMQMLTAFSLSMRYGPQDIRHAVSCGLLPVIQDCILHCSATLSKDSVLGQAFTQLLHILAVSCV